MNVMPLAHPVRGKSGLCKGLPRMWQTLDTQGNNQEVGAQKKFEPELRTQKDEPTRPNNRKKGRPGAQEKPIRRGRTY